jgi:hypothetical protein
MLNNTNPDLPTEEEEDTTDPPTVIIPQRQYKNEREREDLEDALWWDW